MKIEGHRRAMLSRRAGSTLFSYSAAIAHVGSLDTLDENGVVLAFDFHATPRGRLIDRYVRVVIVVIVVFGLLPNFAIVQLEDRVAAPAFELPRD